VAAPKRSDAERNRDLHIVAEMYTKGYTLRAIGETIGVSLGQVQYDLGKIREEWKTSAIADYETRVAIELQKLDRLETQAWAGWERSLLDSEETSTTYKKSRPKVRRGKKSIPGRMQQTEKVAKVKGQAGNPQFLQVVRGCIERRCAILGIDQPKKIAPVKMDEDGKWVSITEEEKVKTIQAIFERAGITFSA
jgi:hypothetical protein